MSATAVVLVVLTATAFPLLLWAIGHAVTAIGERALYGFGRRHQYLAGRLDGVRIIATVEGENEFLVTLATQTADATRATGDPLEGTPLRACLSEDGAVMLADPVLGGNAACEPPVTVTWHATERAISQDQSPTEDK